MMFVFLRTKGQADLFSCFDPDLLLNRVSLPSKSARKASAWTYLNDSPIRQPEEVSVELLEAAEVHSEHRHVNGGTSWVADRILGLEVTAGDTGVAAMVLPDVIIDCHLVRQKAPP